MHNVKRRRREVWFWGLTFELTGRLRRDGLARQTKMYRVPAAGPARLAVAGPVERRVRQRCFGFFALGDYLLRICYFSLPAAHASRCALATVIGRVFKPPPAREGKCAGTAGGPMNWLKSHLIPTVTRRAAMRHYGSTSSGFHQQTLLPSIVPLESPGRGQVISVLCT